MKRVLAISATLAGLILLPPLHSQQKQEKPNPALVLPADINRPAPRLPDGKPDLSGPWDGCWKSGKQGCYGGGFNNDLAADVGMTPA